MKNKLGKLSMTLGLGTLGYWLFRKFRASDHTVMGTMSAAGGDLRASTVTQKTI